VFSEENLAVYLILAIKSVEAAFCKLICGLDKESELHVQVLVKHLRWDTQDIRNRRQSVSDESHHWVGIKGVILIQWWALHRHCQIRGGQKHLVKSWVFIEAISFDEDVRSSVEGSPSNTCRSL
jgi:hypothetical protein